MIGERLTADRRRLGDEVVGEVHGDGFPLIVRPRDERLRRDPQVVADWFAASRDEVEATLLDHAAIMFRGFAVGSTEEFGSAVECYPVPPGGYAGGATQREAIAGRVYEATRTPADIRMMQHQEMSYLPRWPRKLAFWCRHAPDSGGETIIASVRNFEPRVDRLLHDAIAERGLLYTRNFRGAEPLPPVLETHHRPWQETFYTDVPEKAEADLAAMGMDSRWEDDGSLTASFRSEGFAVHPLTGLRHWFNQLASQTFTPQSMGDRWPAYAAHYRDGRPQPYDVRFGDGGAIALDDVTALFPLLDAATVALPYEDGDILMIDNILTFHGRRPYTGDRDVQVALLEVGGQA